MNRNRNFQYLPNFNQIHRQIDIYTKNIINSLFFPKLSLVSYILL